MSASGRQRALPLPFPRLAGPDVLRARLEALWMEDAEVLDGVAVCGEAVEDLVGGLDPHVGLGILVPVGDPDADVGVERLD